MALAHIRNGAIVKRFNEGKGWFQLEGGEWVSPPVSGFTNGNDKIVPIVEETTGVAPSPDTVRTRTETVEADRVYVETNYRAMTAQEITDRDEAAKDGEANSLQSVLLKVITNHENRIRALESRPSVTEAQVRAFLRGLL